MVRRDRLASSGTNVEKRNMVISERKEVVIMALGNLLWGEMEMEV